MVSFSALIGLLLQATAISASERHHFLHRTNAQPQKNASIQETGNSGSSSSRINALGSIGVRVTNDPLTTPLIDNCPKPCNEAGPDPSSWTHVHDHTLLSQCEHDLLFDMNLHTSIHDQTTIRVCSLMGSFQSASTKRKRLERNRDAGIVSFGPVPQAKNSSLPAERCGASQFVVPVTLTAGPRLLSAGRDAAIATSNIAVHMIENAACGARIMFSKSGSAYVGMYIGADILTESVGLLFDQYSYVAL